MDLIALVLSAASLIGVVFLRSYFPTYLSEKGKNLASKEDIAHITRLVESAKADYSLALERHKATLLSESQVIERRRKVYEDICASLRVFIDGHGSPSKAKDSFHAAYASAWLWASDEVLSSLHRFIDLQVLRTASPGSVEQSVLKQSYAEVVVGMRRDVGFPSTVVPLAEYKFVQF